MSRAVKQASVCAILAVLVPAAVAPFSNRSTASTGTLLNATPYTITYLAVPDARSDGVHLSPAARGEDWVTWPTGLLIERGIPGADDLSFALDVIPPIGEQSMFLVLSNYSLYVVVQNDWPSPANEADVAALAVARVLPLD